MTIQNHFRQSCTKSNDYDELNGYALGTYNANETTKYFAGFGKSSRVPDAKNFTG